MIELVLAYILLAAFFFLDSFFRKGKKAKSLEKSESDSKSTSILVLVFITILLLSIALNLLNLGKFDNEPISIFGLAIMLSGFVIRINSILTLGKFIPARW